ncbi:MAG TPA: aconitase/3-isopropylmalate dehydratase large subunit family protein [Prolixibacteraceae bacterium]|jgi:homoaconitate hydratase family protein/3-isopropylmalate dehydratase small subunit|nr:aconitase/3-isopropylmalate dehydratase large subunit family protein [Prolixibacteraceae bacterium]HRV89909.1 aconitase/3-isopropylmalate dehydratase large subunit family protein [Prolixibacteraceae bacterium]
MCGKTFAERVLGGAAGAIVFRKPDLVLSHDNTASIEKIFRKMKGEQPFDPSRLVITLDHNAPPTNAKLANDYQQIRQFVKTTGVSRFHDAGEGICHQLMSQYARPGMIVVGSDSHTCTAGALNAFAAGIDRTETACIWKTGETWFRVPDSLKVTLTGKLPPGVFAKDIALYLIGRITAEGADYLSVEFHGDGVATLTIDDRMTIANLASEMGAKNCAFPPDEILRDFLGEANAGVWADTDAQYVKEITLDLNTLFPVVSAPHQVDHVKAVDEVAGTPIQQALIGTCTNGRLSDLQVAAGILRGKKIAPGVQLQVIPASREIYLEAIRSGLAEIFLQAGASILTPSCGPCLGTGQGIPADGTTVISTANRNFLGRMGNKNAAIYLASPATVALSALEGKITSPAPGNHHSPASKKTAPTVTIPPGDNRRHNGVWNYTDADNLNTDLMFAGNLTYEINSSEPEKILPHLFKGFDPAFADAVKNGDIVIAGENFGCGSSREHPAVGLSYAGVKAVIARSVNRIFFRSAINQGLTLLVLPEAVKAYRPGDPVTVSLREGVVTIAGQEFRFNPLPAKLMKILEKGGLVKALNYQ